MSLEGTRIRHTVVFTPRHGAGTAEEADFLAAAAALAAIPGVEAFEILRETSPKNGYRFGISMEFADAAAYAAYNEHPDHVRFVQDRWLPEIEDFEILRETSPKNDYRFGISMEFAGPEAYTAYNEHPEHVRFVQERWLPEVAAFLEIDYEA